MTQLPLITISPKYAQAYATVTCAILVIFGVVSFHLLANLLGRINLPLGVIGHEGSTLLVTLNGLRLLR